MLTDDTLRKVRETARIDEVASGYLTLHRSGKDFVALCPFHDERHPSFRVSPARNIGKPQQSGKKFRGIIGKRHRHGTGRTLLRYLDAHAADDFGVVVQGAGSTGCTVDSKTRLDVVTHGKTKAATDIFTIQPYRLLEQGQLTNALRGQTGR